MAIGLVDVLLHYWFGVLDLKVGLIETLELRAEQSWIGVLIPSLISCAHLDKLLNHSEP